MKRIIKKVLMETFNTLNAKDFEEIKTHEDMLKYLKNKLSDLESTHGDIFSNYFKMKTDLDKVNYLLNVKYNLTVLQGKSGEYYNAKVKFPFVNLEKGKYPFFNINVGRKDKIDSLSPSEKDSHIRNKINSYFMKRFPLNNPLP
jgi:hypothetical protein